MDWTVDAAIIALTALAQSEPEISTELVQLFLDLVKQQPRPGHVCYLWTVIHCFQQLPRVPKEYREWCWNISSKWSPTGNEPRWPFFHCLALVNTRHSDFLEPYNFA